MLRKQSVTRKSEESSSVIPIGGLERIARPASLDIRTTAHGGHCGFISDYRLNSWSDQFVIDALRAQ